MCLCDQSNYGILGTVISALSRSPGQAACSRSNSLIVDHHPASHAKVSPTNSLSVDARHLSPPPPSLRSNSFLSVDYANHHHCHATHVDTSAVTSPPNGLTSSEDESHLPRRSKLEVFFVLWRITFWLRVTDKISSTNIPFHWLSSLACVCHNCWLWLQPLDGTGNNYFGVMSYSGLILCWNSCCSDVCSR